MKTAIFGIFALNCLALPVIGQSANQRNAVASNASFYRQQAGQQRNATLRQIQWRDTKALGIGKNDQKLDSPRPSTAISSLKDNVPARIESSIFTIFQVVDASNLLLDNADETLWLTGYPAKGLSDDQEVRMVGVVIQKGTRTFETAFGQRTVKLVEFATMEQHKQFDADEQTAIRTAQRDEYIKAYPEWTLKDGTTFRAKFDKAFGSTAVQMLELDTNQAIRKKVAEFHPDDANTLRTIIKTESARKRSQARNR